MEREGRAELAGEDTGCRWLEGCPEGRPHGGKGCHGSGGLDRDYSFKDEALASIGVWAGGYPNRTPSEIVPSVSLSCSTFLVLRFLGPRGLGSG